jgi:hypothetical protein
VGTGIERKTLRGDFGVGSGKKHLSPQIFWICPFYIYFFIFENLKYLFCYALWDILIMSFVWLYIFCYTLWNILATRFCMIISSQMPRDNPFIYFCFSMLHLEIKFHLIS